MPIYPYRCSNKHYVEKFFLMGEQVRELACECGATAKRIYTVPQISVDNMDKVDMRVATGRNFSNKREFEAWLSSKNAHVMDDSEWAADREHLAEQTEFRRDLESRGINYQEYLRDQKDRERKYQDDKLKSLGVKLEVASAEDFAGATAETGWVDTVESNYVGSDGRMSTPKERVACPYSELTNGAVSDI